MVPRVEARRAVPDDAPELVRLRDVMLAASGNDPAPGPWQDAAGETLRKRLAGPEPECTLAAFVVDRPDQPGLLAACAVGVIDLVDWYLDRGVRKIDLKAIAAAAPLYRDLGCTRSLQFTPMRLTVELP